MGRQRVCELKESRGEIDDKAMESRTGGLGNTETLKTLDLRTCPLYNTVVLE